MATTLKQLFNKINQFADNHGQVNDFGVGGYYKIDTKFNRMYPLIWVTPQPSYIKGNSLQITLNLMVADILDGEESNLQDVWSDTLNISSDLVAYFGTFTGYPDMDLRLDESNVYLEPFYHLLDNEVAGYFIKATFISPLPLNYCANPTKTISMPAQPTVPYYTITLSPPTPTYLSGLTNTYYSSTFNNGSQLYLDTNLTTPLTMTYKNSWLNNVNYVKYDLVEYQLQWYYVTQTTGLNKQPNLYPYYYIVCNSEVVLDSIQVLDKNLNPISTTTVSVGSNGQITNII